MNEAIGELCLVMNKISIPTCLSLLALCWSTASAQDSVANAANRSPQMAKGAYQTQVSGWQIRLGDTLQLGRGSGPDKAFACIYQLDSTTRDSPPHRRPLPLSHAGQQALVKQLSASEGGAAYLVLLNTGAKQEPLDYRVDLGKAINSGEILPPVQYRPSAQASPSLPVVGAQQLIDLKALRTKGKISQAEYERRRKAILQKQ